MGSVLSFLIYEFKSGVAFQVSVLILGGLLFAFLVTDGIIKVPSSFVSFISNFSTPLITDLVLVLIYMGMGLKVGSDIKEFREDGLRVGLSGTVMALLDIIPAAILFGYLCEFIFGWPWVLGAILGTLFGETSAAVVVPFLSHVSNLMRERGNSTRHLTKLTNTIKLESTLNSVVLLIFLVIFFNQYYLGNYGPNLNILWNSSISSLVGVFRNHFLVLLFVLAGIPVLVYLTSRAIVAGVRKKVTDRHSNRLRAFATFSLNDIVSPEGIERDDNFEKQFRIGMILYGVVLGIGLFLFQFIGQMTSFAGIGSTMFSLITLIYLGFFIGYLFPGGQKNVVDSSAEETGSRTFTGMMLFHDEFELLARIVFYFSVGISLGLMIFTPSAGNIISAGVWDGILILTILMVPIFIIMRLLAGSIGLPLIFYSRKKSEHFREDFRLIVATMPKGITVAAVSVIILQTGIPQASALYVLALVAVIVSTLEFTVISSIGLKNLEEPSPGVEKGKVISESRDFDGN